MDSAPAASPRSRPSRCPSSSTAAAAEEQVKVRRKTLESVLEQCQRALELLRDSDLSSDPAVEELLAESEVTEEEEREESGDPTNSSSGDSGYETDELCDLLKSRVESPEFLEKLGSMYHSKYVGEETATWDMINAADVWDEKNGEGEEESDKDGYVVVRQEDIVEGVACFMAAYLLSLKQTKELTPNQLQEALSKTFSVKKKKSKLRKAWDGTKVIYNVASWSATAIGIYQNPAILQAATAAFWTSCRVISKLL